MSYFKQEVAARQWRLCNLPELAHPQKIETMNYSHNNIRHIPAHLTLAVQLREIDLSHNRIENIDILGRLVSLRSVKMSNNQISKLGVGLASLTDLQHFDLRQNKLTALVSIEVIRKMLDRRRGFMDVLLDGNQVFRKKRETINGWINSEYALQPFSARQSSKELMGPTVKLRDKQGKKRRNDGLNKRILDLEETVRSRAEKKQEDNSPAINQALENTQNAVDRSEKKLMETTLQNLGIITANLSLLRTSLTLKIPQQLKEMMEKLFDIAGVLGEWLVRSVEQASEDYIVKVQKLSGELKEYHTRIISYLQGPPYAPVEQYTRITKELKKLREITGFILQRVRCIIQVNGRRQALLSIVNISPQKPATRLEEMLLSASEKKSSCDGCFYLTAEVEQLKRKLKEAQVSLDELQAREKDHLERQEEYKAKIAEMTRIGSREQEMQEKQKIIIGQLQCKITPSTYQHVLLQQAKSIELMLKERGKAEEEEGQKRGKWAYFSKDKSKSRMHSLGSQQKPLKTPDLLGSKQNVDSNQQGVSAFQLHEKSEASGKGKETRTRTSGRGGSVNEPKREHTVLSFKEDWVGPGESPLRESVKSGSARNMRNVNMPDSLREAEQYKKYVQYHLRNSIINLLSKKGVEDRRRSKLPVVGHFIHKTHCT